MNRSQISQIDHLAQEIHNLLNFIQNSQMKISQDTSLNLSEEEGKDELGFLMTPDDMGEFAKRKIQGEAVPEQIMETKSRNHLLVPVDSKTQKQTQACSSLQVTSMLSNSKVSQ
jgi:hypothetical protein